MKRFRYGRYLAAASLLSAVLQAAYADTEKDSSQQPRHEVMPVERCGVITKDDAGRSTLLPLPSLQVATESESAPFSLPSDAPPGVSAIACSRRSIVPQPYDYRVIKAGYPLYIAVPAEEKTVALEVREGQMQLRVIHGELTADEATQVQRSVDQMQSLRSKSGHAKPQPMGLSRSTENRPT